MTYDLNLNFSHPDPVIHAKLFELFKKFQPKKQGYEDFMDAVSKIENTELSRSFLKNDKFLKDFFETFDVRNNKSNLSFIKIYAMVDVTGGIEITMRDFMMFLLDIGCDVRTFYADDGNLMIQCKSDKGSISIMRAESAKKNPFTVR